MSLVATERRGAALIIRYANPPFGTMTAAGSTEMLEAVTAAAEDAAVRVLVITGGCRASSSATTTWASFPRPATQWPAPRRRRPVRRRRRAPGRPGSSASPT